MPERHYFLVPGTQPAWGLPEPIGEFDPRKYLPAPAQKLAAGTQAPDPGAGSEFGLKLPTTGQGMVAFCIAVVAYWFLSYVRREGAKDARDRQDSQDRQDGWKNLLEDARRASADKDRMIASRDAQIEKLTGHLLEQSSLAREVAELRNRNAAIGAEKERLAELLRKAQQRLDEHMVLLRQSNGGFTLTNPDNDRG